MNPSSTTEIERQLLDVSQKLENVTTKTELEEIELTLFGRQGLFNKWLSLLKEILNPDEKKSFGQFLNIKKNQYSLLISSKRSTLSSASTEKTDTTIPGIRPRLGRLHPTTEVLRRINQFFKYYGYSVYEGPEIETNEYNFEKLNLPADHPARELADTLYIREPEVLLRTHTSSVETRAMTNEKLPLRIVVPGKVYRNETSNATNNSMFYQYEGLVIDKNISMADLKGTLIEFVKFLYGPETRTRFRCKYYPQVEPGAGLDIECTFCHGKGCGVCKYRGWIEALGSGMVHPNVLASCGIDPKVYSGFAFGMGLDRLVMMSYAISDIRKLYSGELVFDE